MNTTDSEIPKGNIPGWDFNVVNRKVQSVRGNLRNFDIDESGQGIDKVRFDGYVDSLNDSIRALRQALKNVQTIEEIRAEEIANRTIKD